MRSRLAIAPGGFLSVEIAMDRIVQDKVLLKMETDPTKRPLIIRLLAEDNMKQLPQLQAKRA